MMEMEKANTNDRLDPIQFLKIKIRAIRLINTICPADMLAYNRIINEKRLMISPKSSMGAKIILCDPHRASVIGHNFKSSLKPTVMTSPDIRAVIALLIAALSASGESIIQNVEQIDRGYENIVERLKSIGADIERI